jgi:hypothetical protein
VRRLVLLLTVVVTGAAGVGALVGVGCATTQATGEKVEPPRERVPDGGWASYIPGPNYEPKPMNAMTNVNPQMNTVVPVSPTVNPTAGH